MTQTILEACGLASRAGHTGHVERVEQCGERVVVTTSGLIHDSGPNSSAGFPTDDTEGSVLFTIGGKDYCPRSSASAIWNNGVLDFHVLGWGPVVVKRYREGEQLVWEYADGSVTRMNRLCQLPYEHKRHKPRGPRYSLGWDWAMTASKFLCCNRQLIRLLCVEKRVTQLFETSC